MDINAFYLSFLITVENNENDLEFKIISLLFNAIKKLTLSSITFMIFIMTMIRENDAVHYSSYSIYLY